MLLAAVAVVLLVLVAGALIGGLRYASVPDDIRAVRADARRLANQARSLRPADLQRESIDRLAASLGELETSMAPLRELTTGDPLVDVARAVPVISEQVEAADSLVAAADALIEAGGIGLDLAYEVVNLREANEADRSVPLMPGLVELMATSGDDVDRAAELIAEADAHLAAIPDDAAGPILEARDLVAEPLSTYLPLLDDYRDYDDVLPGLLGWGDEKRYLVLAQNPAELRPTGGYAGTVGVLTLRDGAIVEQRFRDVHELSRMPDLPFVEAPDELATYLLGDEQSWRLADANWSPDFPTTAQQALEFYELESGDADIDGVIAITTYALDRLLEVVGPVEVPQHDVTVEPGETTLTLLGATRGSPQSVEGRKEVLDVLARRLTNRLLSLPPGRWIATAEALEDIAQEGMALAWFADPEAQALVEQAGWDGRVRSDVGDYLYVVEANVSPTSKYNLVIDRADSLAVKLDEDGTALNSLRLDWRNAAGEAGEPYRSLREFSNNEDGWYGSYVRVLVPDGAELVTASGRTDEPVSAVERVGEEVGRTSFANYLLMPPGESTMSYLWISPDAAVETDDGWSYQLVVQKQPGARTFPLAVRIDLPDGVQVTDMSEGLVAEEGRVTGEFDLDRDLVVRVAYGLP